MKYFIREIPVGHEKTAMGKARNDANEILSSMGFEGIELPITQHRGIKRLLRQISSYFQWKKALSVLKRGDSLLIQYPPVENSLLLGGYIKKICGRGIDVTILTHDLITLWGVPFYKKVLYLIEETTVFKSVSHIIVHNDSMARFLKYDRTKMVPLEIFDYLICNFEKEKLDLRTIGRTLPVIVAGNLSPYKAPYLRSLPDNAQFNLYGIGFEDKNKPNIHYKGSFLPDELPYELSGSFGLVWDGESTDTCSGGYGEYLKINNPHKASLYLASEIPVVIWSKAALADFVIKYKCGITVDSLHDIASVICNMTDDEYNTLKNNAAAIGKRIRDGEFLKTAALNCAE